ncbi:amidase family protein [Moraxella bovis]|uniref:Amidase domain-containing protein n=1 Tax=Moraxella bovis TaxID=476 RepID=A0AAX3EU09_MORBO|nr:amidase family protein [Moraxella bovis]UZA51468.1 hypothetical protein LP129_13440 [Moraxella bovis]
MTALDLAHAYATGDTCPIKVLDTLYEHIDDAPNAFISLTKELAYAQAQSAKIRWQRGNPLSIFDGIPIAYKDLFDIKQTITTAGAKLRMHAPPATQDAHVVSTLHHMGLTCVGKTNLSEFAYSGLGLNPHFGTPTNVTNPDHVAGGSSSGSATVVGHGIVPLAMGTDTAGSIRIPASFNGLVGFRASRQRYDKQGVFPLADSLDTLGPIAHDVIDCLLIDELELLLEKGIKYDHSLMHNDFTPYYVRVGDSWTKIDYSQHPDTWMKPLVRGQETDLIEIPANWYLDDLPPMMFIKKSPNSHGFVNPRHLEEMWRDQFDWVYREMDYAVFPVTIHPDVSGRPQVLLMLERLIKHFKAHDGVKFVTMNQIADDFAKRCPRQK